MDKANDKKLPRLVQLVEPAKFLTVADLSDVDHAINNSSVSGKRKGSAVMIGDDIYVAQGANPSSSWDKIGSASSSPTSDIIYAGDVDDMTDPTLSTWGSPPSGDNVIILGKVVDEFVGAPSNIPSGEYHGTITKALSANTVDITYTTREGRLYKWVGNAGSKVWAELGEKPSQSIWALKGNTTNTTIATANTPVIFQIDTSKFNAVEQDFLGDLNLGTGNDMKFTVGNNAAYEVQIHGAIEDSANATAKIAISLFDEAANDKMTGSLQVLSPAYSWGGVNGYSFNCSGFARISPNDHISLQVVSDAAATLRLTECIVILRELVS